MSPFLSLILCLAGSADGGPSLPLDDYSAKPGDIVLFQGKGGFKNALFALGGSACATHVGIVTQRPDGSLALFEAPGLGYPVMLSDIPSRLRSSKGRIWVRRLPTPLTPEQSHSLTAFACSQLGKPYDAFGFLLPPFGHPLRKFGSRCLTAKQLDPPRWFCSSIVIAAAVAAGQLDPCKVKLRTTDPQDLKVDRDLDLSGTWDKPERLIPCGPLTKGWFSISCCGKTECWE